MRNLSPLAMPTHTRPLPRRCCCRRRRSRTVPIAGRSSGTAGLAGCQRAAWAMLACASATWALAPIPNPGSALSPLSTVPVSPGTIPPGRGGWCVGLRLPARRGPMACTNVRTLIRHRQPLRRYALPAGLYVGVRPLSGVARDDWALTPIAVRHCRSLRCGLLSTTHSLPRWSGNLRQRMVRSVSWLPVFLAPIRPPPGLFAPTIGLRDTVGLSPVAPAPTPRCRRYRRPHIPYPLGVECHCIPPLRYVPPLRHLILTSPSLRVDTALHHPPPIHRLMPHTHQPAAFAQ